MLLRSQPFKRASSIVDRQPENSKKQDDHGEWPDNQLELYTGCRGSCFIVILSTHAFVSLPVRRPLSLLFCGSVQPPVRLSACISVCVCPSVCLSICLPATGLSAFWSPLYPNRSHLSMIMTTLHTFTSSVLLIDAQRRWKKNQCASFVRIKLLSRKSIWMSLNGNLYHGHLNTCRAIRSSVPSSFNSQLLDTTSVELSNSGQNYSYTYDFSYPEARRVSFTPSLVMLFISMTALWCSWGQLKHKQGELNVRSCGRVWGQKHGGRRYYYEDIHSTNTLNLVGRWQSAYDSIWVVSYTSLADQSSCTWSWGIFLHLGTGLHFLEKFQEIPTKGATQVAAFKTGSALFLAIANSHGDKHKYKTTSDVYKLEGGRFLHYQTLHTKGAMSIKHFTIHGNSYLAFANSYDGSTYRTNSVIYKWNGKMFTVFQEIPTLGAHGVTFFSVGGTFYLAFANYHDDRSHSINSFVFQWKSGT